MRMAVNRHHASFDRTPAHDPRGGLAEAARCVEPNARHTADASQFFRRVQSAAKQAFGEADVQRPIGHAAELIAGFPQRFTQPLELGAIGAGLSPLGETERPAGCVIERLVVRRYERHDWCSDALLECVFTLPKRFQKRRTRELRQPFMAMRMTGHFVAGLMETSHLVGIMIRTVAGERGRSDDRKARRHLVSRVQLEQLFGIGELAAPVFGTAVQTRSIATPLCVVVPEKQQRAWYRQRKLLPPS